MIDHLNIDSYVSIYSILHVRDPSNISGAYTMNDFFVGLNMACRRLYT